MADKRDSSQQRRAKENRAARDALAARKEAAARKDDGQVEAPAAVTSPKQPTAGRRTRAQAAPVAGQRSSARTTQSSSSATAKASAAALPEPIIPTEGSWIQRVAKVPGGRAVLLSVALSIAAAAAALLLTVKIPVERWDGRLQGKAIVACVVAKDGKVAQANGKNIATGQCSPLAKEPAKKGSHSGDHTDNTRLMALIKSSLWKFLGPGAVIYVIPPILISAAAVAYALRPSRRRVWNWATFGFGAWMLLFGIRLNGPFFLVAFLALGFGLFQLHRAEPRPRRAPPPARSPRSSGKRRGAGRAAASDDGAGAEPGADAEA